MISSDNVNQMFHNNSRLEPQCLSILCWKLIWLSTTGNQHRFDFTLLGNSFISHCGDWFDLSDSICSPICTVFNFSWRNSQNVIGKMTVFDTYESHIASICVGTQLDLLFHLANYDCDFLFYDLGNQSKQPKESAWKTKKSGPTPDNVINNEG